MDRKRVAVIGVGSVGGVFASELMLADRHDVVLCARRPFDQLIIESEQFPGSHAVQPVIDPAAVGEPVDWVLVATKAQQLEGARGWTDRLCGPDTTLVVVQNGIEQADRGRRVAPRSRVIGAVTYCGAEAISPGRIRHQSDARLHVPDDADGNGSALAALFEGTRATIDVTDHWAREAWWKLLLNVVLNGPTAITSQPGSVLGQPAMTELARGLAEEVIAVADAAGVELGDDAADKAIGALPYMAEARPSMLQDREAGRAMEHDAIYGAVLRAADRVGVEVPRVHALHAVLEAIDQRRS